MCSKQGYCILVGCFIALETSALSQSPSLKVNVRVYNHVKVRRETLQRAQSETSRVFGQAGVELRWLPDPSSEDGRHEQLHQATNPGQLVLNIKLLDESIATRLHRTGSRFGLALHVDAFVFFQRVEEEARNGTSSTSTILGHIMAHELGHLLLGEDSHSSDGIMTETLRQKHF